MSLFDVREFVTLCEAELYKKGTFFDTYVDEKRKGDKTYQQDKDGNYYEIDKTYIKNPHYKLNTRGKVVGTALGGFAAYKLGKKLWNKWKNRKQ